MGDFDCCDRGEHEATRKPELCPWVIRDYVHPRDERWKLPFTLRCTLEEGHGGMHSGDDGGGIFGPHLLSYERRGRAHNDFDHCPGCQAAHQTKEANR